MNVLKGRTLQDVHARFLLTCSVSALLDTLLLRYRPSLDRPK